MVESKVFAEYILVKAHEKNVEMNLTKLQKILYICDGSLLARGENMVNENARVFDYGPVYPKAYKWYKKHEFDDFSKKNSADFPELEKSGAKKIVEDALDFFGGWSAGQLSEWSHRPNSPWAITRDSSGMYSPISKDVMKAFFGAILNG